MKFINFLISILMVFILVLINDVEAKDNTNYIRVDIKGSVNNPGVYKICEDSIINDLIIKAGGLTMDANTSYINLAQVLNDGDVVIVYSNNDIEKLTNGNVINISYQECKCPDIESVGCISKITNNSTLININTASLDELNKLSGIGESKAKAIIEYRNNNSFTKIEDITNIKGIGTKIFEKIKDNITV